MSEQTCSHNCSSCGSDCASRTAPKSMQERCNPQSHVQHVIAVVSGKGGVGKSLVTSALAVQASRSGKRVGILDADVTGPSIPKAFGLHGRAEGDGEALYPARTASGIGVMSINLLLEDSNDPVVWRGPMIANVVKQFWTDVVWGDVDFLFVDMPPGTGDVPLTVFQSLPVDGIIVVTSPQELVSMIVEKAVRMAEMMHVPVLGVVENLSGFRCPDCGAVHEIFGRSNLEEIAARHGIGQVERVPVDPALAELCDLGCIEQLPETYLSGTAAAVCAIAGK
ncbi:MAG: P-loop NTPase [Candidatus Aphodomorpha sp.]